MAERSWIIMVASSACAAFSLWLAGIIFSENIKEFLKQRGWHLLLVNTMQDAPARLRERWNIACQKWWLWLAVGLSGGLAVALAVEPHLANPLFGSEAQKAILIQWLQQAQRERNESIIERDKAANEAKSLNEELTSIRSNYRTLAARSDAVHAELMAKTAKLAEAQSTIADQLTGTPRLPKNPYTPGPIFKHSTYMTHELALFLAALDEYTRSANDVMRLPNPVFLSVGRDEGRGSFEALISRNGLAQAIKQLTEFRDSVAPIESALKQTVLTHGPMYATELERLRGDTGISSLLKNLDTYVSDLHNVESLHLGDPQLQRYVLPSIRPTVIAARNDLNNLRHWADTFVKERVPEARRELEVFMPRQLR